MPSVSPPVVTTRSLGRMTRLTQGLQVRLIMRATIFERDDVVNLLGWRHTPLSLALFAQRVGLDVGVADFAPAVVVALVDRRVTLIRPVPLVFCTSVSRAEVVVGEFWAAGLGAGAFRFPRYHTHLPRIRQDPPDGLPSVWGAWPSCQPLTTLRAGLGQVIRVCRHLLAGGFTVHSAHTMPSPTAPAPVTSSGARWSVRRRSGRTPG